VRYEIPVICVGNLSVGGTGKTPMIEYLVRILRKSNRVATLSRGYKRRSKGFIIADEHSSALLIGDEPFQFYSKFDDIIVSVDSNRRNGISNLLSLESRPEVILLDDAFQHRKVKAGLNILLTTFDNPFCNDLVLPTGNLREPRSGANRADIIIVTKCPNDLNDSGKLELKKKLNVRPNQKLFFSTISYSETIFSESENQSISNFKGDKFTLVTGIANSKPLLDFLILNGFDFEHLNFPDHHQFSDAEIVMLKQKKCILTSEKDYMRLKHFNFGNTLYYLPIEMQISDGEDLDQLIRNFVNAN
jgi:tetraacyldisaccharide 4'-kinase